MITSVTYTCSKEGQYNSKLTTQEKGDHENLQNDNTSKKEISLRRTGCKAHMRVRLVNTTKWTVTTFTKEHNHELIVSLSKARFFRSHRTITKEQKELIHMLSILEFTLINQTSGSTNEGSIKNSTQNIHEITISRSSELNLLVTDYPPQSQCKGKRRLQRFKPQVEKKVDCMTPSEKGDSSDSFEKNDQSDAGLL
uniref:FAR1 domain-containing protein n=1 Tax=Ananas comosus var. bracteatus TaxID=296719 RepID=A0A6V7PEK5_ANACO|nr:unnamed protein product [Ananas comosus var. bracteatus]